ncbi:hypothetical protein LIN78_17005 [Leeia sp. TBRC 13508]|uniref:Uncharacterized protein n=1 Tax=Leeia speluncae TaxID=2884804 RepID=A0ABS8DB72_9NEIS|nr:hypothetical protein [Leeia speluncae]MCB6185248.1 hypothetical protein [Leeia speluncae]
MNYSFVAITASRKHAHKAGIVASAGRATVLSITTIITKKTKTIILV